ncbi:MAG TPA: hypothetical protein VKU41_03275 [Polyangiaceae bacterium]|nr:hypothetical protein [Polyangiaceae bacterium]
MPLADGGCSTTASGVVYDPAGKNPLYGVSVYVPRTPPTPLAQGVSCAGCAALYPSTALTGAVTDASGRFTLPNMPIGINIPVVVQAGKWRRMYTLPQVTGCRDNAFSTQLTLPSKHDPTDPTIGDMPNIAVVTGGLDTLECLFVRMGIDPSEYTGDPQGTGSIKIFPGYNGATVADAGAAVPSQRLWDSASDLSRFDLVLLSCEGRETVDGPAAAATALTDADRQNLFDYVNGGGRVFASHYNYAWFNTGPFNAVTPPMASWLTGSNAIDDSKAFPANVTTTIADGGAFPEGTAMKQCTSRSIRRSAVDRLRRAEAASSTAISTPRRAPG